LPVLVLLILVAQSEVSLQLAVMEELSLLFAAAAAVLEERFG
jgi:hypothetical protein